MKMTMSRPSLCSLEPEIGPSNEFVITVRRIPSIAEALALFAKRYPRAVVISTYDEIVNRGDRNIDIYYRV